MIRSITIGLPLETLSTAEIDERVHALIEAAAGTLGQRGLAPRTARFTLPASGSATPVRCREAAAAPGPTPTR